MNLVDGLAAYALFALSLHIASQVIVSRRLLSGSRGTPAAGLHGEPITIVRPVSRNDPFLHDTLQSSFQLSWPDARIIFCAARESDEAVPVVRMLLAEYPDAKARLLIGFDPISENPKLNNCFKGWQAADTDLVALVDSNVLLPTDYVEQMLSAWGDACGMVTSPPLGEAPGNFWSEIECSFLNSHQARWQLVADEMGAGFAQGKNLLFRKSILEPLGGIANLAQEAAEDAAATTLLRRAGYQICLSRTPFPQPLGTRSLSEIWARQVRWAKLRRATFPLFYFPEILAGVVTPALALAIFAALRIDHPASAVLAFLTLWFGSEFAFARAVHWASRLRALPAMIVRDLLLPCVWVAGFIGNSFEWQGHAMSARPATNEDGTDLRTS